MTLRPTARSARYLAFSALAFVAFEACSNSSNESSSAAPSGPVTLALNPPSTTLACDGSLVVSVTTNLTLRPPYYCGTTPQCGSLAVTLLETEDGPALIAPVRAATADVQLDLASLVTPPNGDAPTLSEVHFIKVQAYGDSLSPYPVAGGGTLSDVQPVALSAATDCTGGANAGGAGGMAGASNAGANNAGADQSGEGGAPSTGGIAGAGAGEGGAGGEAGSAAGATG